MHLFTWVLPHSSSSDPIFASAKQVLQQSGVLLGSAGTLEDEDGTKDELDSGPTG